MRVMRALERAMRATRRRSRSASASVCRSWVDGVEGVAQVVADDGDEPLAEAGRRQEVSQRDGHGDSGPRRGARGALAQ
ncbi:hypothetical protein NVS55_37445 [Myxococcus stipitatus]|uniref:hypothetical protein n=1 Tax=Myxococcus stipitatus TaxID=83455 RepID=UPI003144E4C4